MTLKARILEALVSEFPYNLTNQQLAIRLEANEPSVRRAVKQLEVAGKVQYDTTVDYSRGTIGWAATHEAVNSPLPLSSI